MLKKRGKKLKKNSNNDPMLIKKIITRRKAQEIEKKSPYILLFHCSGLTSRQWRQLKNILCTFQGRTSFQSNYRGKLPYKKKARWFYCTICF
jgi:hypothetical protein